MGTLADQLFADAALREAYGNARTAADARGLELRLCLLIGPTAQDLQALRWELLVDPVTKRPLATSERTLFSRFMDSSDYRPIHLSPKAALNALVAIAAPDDWQTWSVAEVPRDGEIARARTALEDIDVDVLEAPLTLERLLARLREQEVDVLYLVCHGVIQDREPYLLLQKDDGTGVWTPGEDLADRIAELRQAPRMAVLASCQSAGTEDGFDVRGKATAQSSLAPRLAEAGVPAIVAMQGQVSMETVEKAMPVFFRELLVDGQIDRAMAVARGAVRDRADHWMPALFLRLKDGRIWHQDSTSGYRTMATPPDGFVHRRELDDDDVRAAYPDGVLWATMGDKLGDADRLARVQGLLEWWDPAEKGAAFTTLESASARLREVLTSHRVFLVVDDAWQSADVEAFRGAATLLVTTRYSQTLPAACRRIDVDAMDGSEAVELLVSELDADEPARFAALARRLGEWPLLLRLVNRQLRERAAGGLDAALHEVEEELDEAGVTAFDVEDDSARDKAVARTFEVSLRRLGADRERFEELAVFPEDADVPLVVVERLWRLRPAAARKLCGRFHDLSLLLLFDRQARMIRLHDVVRQYLTGVQGDIVQELHGRLLERNTPESENWAELPRDEDYLWRHLAYHLTEADERDALRELLFDFGYLLAKISAVGINALLGDYDVLGEDGPTRTVEGALRLSAHVVAKDASQLAGQLLGRLDRREPNLGQLLGDAARCAPLALRSPTLTRPGGALLWTLEGPTSGVHSVAVLDANRVVATSGGRTLQVWDVESGQVVQTLEGTGVLAVQETSRVVYESLNQTLRVWDVERGQTVETLEDQTWVGKVAVLDTNRVVFTTAVGSLRVWDVESGQLVQTLEGHTSSVLAVAVLDSNRVVSASSDKTLRVWDIESGQTLRILEGHTSGVHGVAVLDSNRVVSGSDDGTLRVWDVERGQTLGILEGHTSAVLAVAALGPNRVISVSSDNTLRVWDVERGQAVRTLEGHTSGVLAVAALALGV